MGFTRVCALGILLSLACGVASARVVYVNRNISPAVSDGATWATALKSVTLALAAAQPGDEIWVAAGFYPESVTLKSGVGLYGGFVGFETQLGQRLGIPSLTALEGNGHAPVVSTPRDVNVKADTVLDGFTIRNGVAVNPGGAGVVIQAGAPTITHNVIVNNTSPLAGLNGGGIYCATGSRPLIADNIIAANSADAGGGICISGASPTVVNNTIVGNSGTNGGGLYIVGSTTGVYANNIIAYNLTGVFMPSQTAGFHHNCVYGNELGDFTGQSIDPDPAHTIRADPMLASYAFGNMHIQPGSPCRDAGDDAVTTLGGGDVDLQPRQIGAHRDIGADESDGREWTAQPSTVYVRSDADDANDGSSWAKAKRTMAAALTAASRLPGAEVWVATGTYPKPYTPGQPYEPQPYVLPAFVYLYGGFAGTETERSQRNWAANPCVLSAGKYTAMVSRAGQHQSAIDGFVIVGGLNYNYPQGAASGIACLGGSPAISNNAVVGNMGAISLWGSAAAIDNNAIVGNSPAYPNAAPVACTLSAPVFTHNLVADNGPTGGTVAPGAISITDCPAATIANNLFRANRTIGNTNVASVLVTLRSKATVANNTLVYNTGANLAIGVGSKILFANNILAFADRTTTGTVSSSVMTAVSNCIYSPALPLPLQAPFTAAQGNIAAYPAFANIADDDYRLGPGSLCVDAGDDRYAWAGETDLDGLPRVLGRGVDIGAYESSYAGATRSWPDVARILRMAGGLSVATDAALLDGDQQAGLTVADAIAMVRWLRTHASR